MISNAIKNIIAPCLWGAAVNLLDLEADKFLIIERVLEHGGDRQIEFVLANFKHEDIICVVQQISYLSPRPEKGGDKVLPEAIPASVATLLNDIHTWPLPVDTYMADGTAVAIYLNHRVSVDIGLFTDKEFYCGSIISPIGQKYVTTITNAAEKNTLVAMVANVRFSLFHYPYPLPKPLMNKPECNIKLASPEDIAAMKVIAIMQRGTAKDFVDLNALMRAFGLTLDYLMSLVKEKYGVSEDYGYQIKRSLVYFDDAVRSLGDVTVIRNGKEERLDKREWSEIEEFFKKLVYSPTSFCWFNLAD